jgi:micrococcal nuclease
VVDGDTLWLSGRKLRLKGFDTPETETHICGGQREVDLGNKATARLIQLLNNGDWTVEYHGKESNAPKARELVTIRIAGRDVGQILTDEHLARVWPDGAEWWCSSAL